MWRFIEYSRDCNTLINIRLEMLVTYYQAFIKHLNQTTIVESLKNDRYLSSFCTNIKKISVETNQTTRLLPFVLDT